MGPTQAVPTSWLLHTLVIERDSVEHAGLHVDSTGCGPHGLKLTRPMGHLQQAHNKLSKFFSYILIFFYVCINSD